MVVYPADLFRTRISAALLGYFFDNFCFFPLVLHLQAAVGFTGYWRAFCPRILGQISRIELLGGLLFAYLMPERSVHGRLTAVIYLEL